MLKNRRRRALGKVRFPQSMVNYCARYRMKISRKFATLLRIKVLLRGVWLTRNALNTEKFQEKFCLAACKSAPGYLWIAGAHTDADRAYSGDRQTISVGAPRHGHPDTGTPLARRDRMRERTFKMELARDQAPLRSAGILGGIVSSRDRKRHLARENGSGHGRALSARDPRSRGTVTSPA